MNNRRKLVIALGAGALTASFHSFAQLQGKVWRLGFLSPRSRPESLDSDAYGALPRRMRELGYVEGKNLLIEWRFAEGNNERLPGLAAELVSANVDVIVTTNSPSTSAAQKATATVPIVMGGGSDPVANGFVKTFARPAGNITGVTSMSYDTSLKQLEMLLAMAPKLSRLAVLLNPSNATQFDMLETIQAVGHKRGIVVMRADARIPQEIDSAFSLLRQQNAGALIVLPEPLFLQQKIRIAELAVRHHLPSISADRTFSEVGLLMSYGASSAESFRRAATYVDKIFKGAKPADIPVEQPTKFELVLNMKTAKALGIKIPQSILVRADKVIE